MTTAKTTLDPARFRHVMGHLPTGVAVISAQDRAGNPVGMAVGTFLSISLDPPLVGFFPADTSTSFPRIEDAGRFCVNILAQDQRSVCHAFAAQGGDKFASVSWHLSPAGLPWLDDAVAWIECEISSVTQAGDHKFVQARPHALTVDPNRAPMVFWAGTYHSLDPAH